MNKKLKIILILIFIFIISYFLGFFISYFMYDISYEKVLQNEEDNLNINLESEEEILQVSYTSSKISEDTVLIFHYIDNENNYIKTFEDLPPYYLIGLERSEVEKIFLDWELVSFSSDKVTFKKYIEDDQSYFLSVYNDKIAIFSKDEVSEENLIEVLNTSLISLPLEEQEKIKKGIYINGKNELINYIQNYES